MAPGSVQGEGLAGQGVAGQGPASEGSAGATRARIPVAVLGATGAVGQRFVALLSGHPTFRLAAVVGDQSAGRMYAEAAAWLPDTPLPPEAAGLRVTDLATLRPDATPVVFSALPGKVAGPIESDLAARGFKVFTNAGAHRMDAEVPLVIPEVNADHLELVRRQRGPGWIVANGNCTAIVLTLPLAALHVAFGVEEVHATSLQALSGAGYPGVSALDVADNVLVHIPGEEEKMAREPNKTLGRLTLQGIEEAGLRIHATCTRVPVREGHVVAAHLRLQRAASLDGVRKALEGFRGPPDLEGLPTAPRQPIHVHDAPDRPQPRRDRDREGGMAVSVGRLRLDADGRGLRLVALGSNTVRGAAGASLLNAELAHRRGYLV